MTPEQCLDQVWQILAASGINAGGPPGTASCGWFPDLPRHAQAEIYETSDQTLTWTYVQPSDAGEAARMTTALLRGGPVSAGLPYEEAGLLLRDEAARMLQAAGLATLPSEFCYQAGESYPELLVIDPAAPSRGIVRITSDGDIFWEFRPAAPGSSGLDPYTAARAITAALGQAQSCHGAGEEPSGCLKASPSRVPVARARPGDTAPASGARARVAHPPKHRRRGAQHAAVAAGPARPGKPGERRGTVHHDAGGRPARHAASPGVTGVPAPLFPGWVLCTTNTKEA